MTRTEYERYVALFNAEDTSAFRTYLTEDVRVCNGHLEYQGVQGMIDHYAKIWGNFKETLNVLQYIGNADNVAVELHTHFDVLVDDEQSLFGPVKAGETFDYYGIVMYRLREGRFCEIKVSYLDFVHTDLSGKKTSLGIVH